MTPSPLSLDTIKFHLIWNKDFNFSGDGQAVSLEELIEYLIESLEDADKATVVKAENLLTRIGRPAVPYLVRGLKSGHNRVKSVCAMVLVRIGQPAAEEMKAFFVRHRDRPQTRWVAEFILGELGVDVARLEKQLAEIPAAHPVIKGKVVPLSKPMAAGC